jgi:hypothetical protein
LVATFHVDGVSLVAGGGVVAYTFHVACVCDGATLVVPRVSFIVRHDFSRCLS